MYLVVATKRHLLQEQLGLPAKNNLQVSWLD